MGILRIALPFGIANARSPKPGFFIDETIYVRFGQSSSFVHMHDGGGSSKDMRIYSKTFSVIVADNINVRIFEKIAFK